MSSYDEDLYEINKWLDEHYSFQNYEKHIREFIEKKYGKQEVRKRLVEIKELAHFLERKM
jgi:site-specific recombinase XerD